MSQAILAVVFSVISLLVSQASLAADDATTAATQPAGASQSLRYVFQKGQVFNYTIKVEHHTRIPSPTAEPDLVLSSVATLHTTWTVRDMKANGDSDLEIAIKRFMFSADAPMIGKIVIDSDKAPDPAQQPAASIHQIFSALQVGTAHASITPGGKVSSFQWREEATKALVGDAAVELSGFFGDLFSAAGAQRYLTSPIAILPAEGIKPGGEWKTSATVFGIACQDVYRLAPAKPGNPADGLVVLAITSGVHFQGDKETQIGIGSLKFNAIHGHLSALDRHYDLPISGPGGGHTSATISVTLQDSSAAKSDHVVTK